MGIKNVIVGNAFFGHVMTREKREHLVITGMLYGEHSRGRLKKRGWTAMAS